MYYHSTQNNITLNKKLGKCEVFTNVRERENKSGHIDLNVMSVLMKIIQIDMREPYGTEEAVEQFIVQDVSKLYNIMDALPRQPY